MYAAAKEVLRLQGIDIGSVRAPLMPLTEDGKPKAAAVKKMIDEAKAEFLGA
jgi:N-acetylneuraminate lyase